MNGISHLNFSITEESALSFLQMMNLMPGNLFFKDINGRYRACNEHLQKFMQKSQSVSNMLGMNDHELLGDYAELIIPNDKWVLSNKKELTIVENGFNENGKPATYLSKKIPIFNDKNDLLGILGMSIDVTNPENRKTQENIIDELSKKLICKTPSLIRLSKQQAQCLYYTLHGKSAKSIAAIMQLSQRTVEEYIEIIKKKLNCAKKSELMSRAIELGLVSINVENGIKTATYHYPQAPQARNVDRI